MKIQSSKNYRKFSQNKAGDTITTHMSKLISQDILVYQRIYSRRELSILFHNSEFCIPNSEIRTTNFGIRNCEVYVMWQVATANLLERLF